MLMACLEKYTCGTLQQCRPAARQAASVADSDSVRCCQWPRADVRTMLPSLYTGKIYSLALNPLLQWKFSFVAHILLVLNRVLLVLLTETLLVTLISSCWLVCWERLMAATGFGCYRLSAAITKTSCQTKLRRTGLVIISCFVCRD